MHNKDLPFSDERNLILSTLTGAVKFGGSIEIDNDDDNGHFTITQTWMWDDKKQTRTISGRLVITNVNTEESEL